MNNNGVYGTNPGMFSSLQSAGYDQTSGFAPALSTAETFYFRVCRRFRSRGDLVYMDIPKHHTWTQLKEKVCEHFSLAANARNFFLSRYDERESTWSSVDETNRYKTIDEYRFPRFPTFNIEIMEETNPSTVNDNPFILKLCRQPMDKTSSISIDTRSSQTVGQCKQQAQEKVTDQRTDHLYRWQANDWEKLESAVDDVTLAELHFLPDSFISFKPLNDRIPGVCGLTNLGNTCFMNSALQCLSHIPQLTERVLSLGTEINAPTIGAYISLIKTLWSGEHSVTTLSSLLLNIRDSLPRFTRYRQHDAQEFMNYFLHLIHEELTNEQTLISELFHGKMRSNVECQGGCRFKEINDETFTFLPLPVDNDKNQHQVLFLRTNGEQQQVSVRGQIRVISELLTAFIDQYRPKLSTRYIRAVGLDTHRDAVEYNSHDWLDETKKYQLGLIELPEKTVYQTYVKLVFRDRKTCQPFRPPLFLRRPVHECRYIDLIDQINRVREHLYFPSEGVSDELFWVSDQDTTRPLEPGSDENQNLLFMEKVIIVVEHQWAVKYIDRHSMERFSGKPSLEKLLADFFRSELLEGDYHCSKCGGLRSARQKAELVLPLPPVLIIQLKRFTYERYSNDKIDTHIEFPLEHLDLNAYVAETDLRRTQPSALYRLVAVSNHTGSLTSGHYVTYGRNPHTKRWYCFNDERVEEIEEVVTKNAYILIYVQETC